MTVYTYDDTVADIKPPATSVGVLGWGKHNLFDGWFNSVLTLVVVAFLIKALPPLIKWAFLEGHWASSGAGCQNGAGACWSVITANLRFIIFGFYPHDLQWRPLLAMILLVVLLFYSRDRNHWRKALGWGWLVGLFVMGVLLRGGLFGMTVVESTQWGGLPLTLLLSVFGLTAAYPLGIVLALGRASHMKAIKTLCVVYIEMIRGVPLISLLFMSSVIFPLFLPEG
ncbi:ABC transporter permease subunit [Desulfosarcina cetonica]|uniref:ABC transporter permease subunit n=1 Tax=Desulfosarcina cetonica TaxID=90730 RepID=UPI001FEF0998|nr:ABC transporter permease subunit [Desulfosarcina cetonica]